MQFRTLPALFCLTPMALGNIELRASCSGVQQDGYCCNGSVFRKDSSSTDYSAANMICCEGDPHVQIDTSPNAPTSCTAGTEVPLTQASEGGTSQPTQSTSSATSSDSPAQITSSSNANGRIQVDTPVMAAVAALGGLAFGL
jgi:hypothetical protein